MDNIISHKNSNRVQKDTEVLKAIQDESIDIRNRTMYFFGGIDTDSAARFIKNLHFLDRTPGDVTIYLNTPGGEWSAGTAIYDALVKTENNTIAIVIGECCSMGTIILQGFRKRVSTPYSSFMIHPGSIGTKATVPDFLSRAKYEAETLEQMYSILWDKMTATKELQNFNYKKFKKKYDKDVYLFPKEALAIGLIDEIE